jgi:hypothetical protein
MAKPTPDPDRRQRRIQLRVDAALYDEVAAFAQSDDRTLNAAVVRLLREALDARSKAPAGKRPRPR